jgi:uncharacterized protein YigA (DUF484 family)
MLSLAGGAAMNRDDEVKELYHSAIDNDEKIHLLEELVVDLINEMEAEDQNMHPDIHNKLSEGLRLARDYLRVLHENE